MLNLQSAPREAGLLRAALVGLATVLITLGYSVRVLMLSAFGRLRRNRVDSYAREWSGRLLGLTGARLSRHGEVPDFGDGRRYMILCTHSSFYDIPAIFVTMPGSIRMLAKRELFAVPVWGAAMRAAEFPSIDRHNRHQAMADLARAREMMESGIVLWAAPEGTRSRDGRLQPFKKGCFRLAQQTDAIIVPVAIRGVQQVLPAGSVKMNLGMPVEVHIGAPIDSIEFSERGVDALMATVRERMLELLEPSTVPAPAPALKEQTPA
ncbi:lysophospholipid acyltransferase family protein [Pseudomonas nitroreducens]|uniref:lysophospholipid acyltransferase family protein n=1 Tax=Pseudomonas nitroreducens TaxID=46680 RepID=UPI0037F824E7